MAVSCPSWSQPAQKKRAQSTVEHMLCPHQTVCLLLQQAQVYHLSLKAYLLQNFLVGACCALT